MSRRAVELLKSRDHQGWKALRAADRGSAPSFAGLDLTGLSLHSNDIENGWDLSGCDFDRAKLCGSRIVRANLTDASFRGADLDGAELGFSTLVGCDLRGARMVGTSLKGVSAAGATIEPSAVSCLFCGAEASVERDEATARLNCASCGRYRVSAEQLRGALLVELYINNFRSDRTAATAALDYSLFARTRDDAGDDVSLEHCPFCSLWSCRARRGNDVTCVCRACGLYQLPKSAADFATMDELSLRKICWRLRERFDEQVLARAEPRPVRVDPKLLAEVSQSVRAPDDPLDCLRLLVGWIQARSQPDGRYVGLRDVDFAIAHSSSPRAMSYLIEQAAGLGWIEHQTNEGWRLTLDGWKQALEWRRKKPDVRQVFVAMSFDKRYDAAWKALDAAIRKVGLIPMRVDQLEHNEKICDRLMAEIRRSGLVIADCSHGSGNVYFEAGFALGLGLTVIWTCQESEKDGLKFDTRQYAHILWSDPGDLATKIVNRLNATILPLE